MNILRTERTIIDSIALEDAAFFVTLVNSPNWLRFIGNRHVRNVDDARRYLQSGFLRSYRENGFGYYLVRTTEAVPIGICGFLKKPQLKNVDFGFALLPDFYGQGYGFESALAVLNYGIETYAFQVLDAVTSSDNLRSKRLLEKLNFVHHRKIDAENGTEELELFRWRVDA